MSGKVTKRVDDSPFQVHVVKVDNPKHRSKESKWSKKDEGLELLPEGYHSEVKIEFLTHDDFTEGKTDLSHVFSCEVTDPKYEDLRTGPFAGTLYDPKMGSIPGVGEQTNVCLAEKCGMKRDKCPGHFGIIRMPKGKLILNPILITDTIKLLGCMCILKTHESRNRLYIDHNVLIEKGILSLPAHARIAKIESMSSGACTSCNKGKPEMKVKFSKKQSAAEGVVYYKIGSSKTTARLTANDINDYLSTMPAEELKLLGLVTQQELDMPGYNIHRQTQRFTINAIPVPPTILRMPKLNNGKKTHDDITVRLAGILNAIIAWKGAVTNDELLEEMKRLGLTREDTEKSVQAELTYIENEIQKKRDYAAMHNIEEDETEVAARQRERNSREARLAFLVANRDALTNIGKRGTTGGTADLAKAVYVAVKNHFKELGGLFQSKEGIIRSQILGKRSSYTARAVIGPAVSCCLDEIEVPEYIASRTGVPETVSDDNRLYLQKMLEDGQIIEFESTKSDVPYQVTGQRITEGHCRLRIGDSVTRRLMNGDVVLIGRQPTLHKGNFMAFRVRITGRRSSAGIPFAITTPLGGDFDGDTIHMYFPQTEEARKEAMETMYVLRNIIGGRTGAPIIAIEYGALKIWHIVTREGAPLIPPKFFHSIVYDSLDGIDNTHNPYFYEKDDEKYESVLLDNEVEIMNSLTNRCAVHGIPLYSGKALFSSLLPTDFVYPPGGKPRKDDNLLILDGILVSGQLNKRHLGANQQGTIVHYIHKDYGWRAAAEFIQRCYRMADQLHDLYGLTFSYEDAFFGLDEDTKAHYDKLEEDMERKVSLLGEIPTDPYKRAAYEQEVLNITSIVDGQSTKDFLLKKLSKRTVEEGGASALYLGMQAGTKGGITEIFRTAGPAGQFRIRGERPEMEMSQGSRCLSVFRPEDTSLSSRGFSMKGMATGGMTPSATFFGYMSVRESQAATQNKTPVSGEIARELIMTLQNYITENGMVVFRGGFVSDFIAGNDGFDAEKLVPVDGKLFFFNPSSLADRVNAALGWSKGVDGSWYHRTVIDGEECYVKY